MRDRNCHELEETVTGSEFIERTKGCTELKKREPCLVPLSMSVGYLLEETFGLMNLFYICANE